MDDFATMPIPNNSTDPWTTWLRRQQDFVFCYQVKREQAAGIESDKLSREHWDTWDPMLIAEGLFAGANIFR